MPPRSPWRTALATLAISTGIVLLGGAAFVYGGFHNVAATEHHWPATHWLLETARVRSIRARAHGIIVPPMLDSAANLAMGTEHFAAHCAVCHGAPGVPKGDIALGMYPPPADLAVAARRYTDPELFWIIMHGIKMTGMPAWADHSDAAIWATVAFLKKLAAGMTEQQYGELIKASMMRGMRHEPGGGSPPAAEMPHKHWVDCPGKPIT